MKNLKPATRLAAVSAAYERGEATDVQLLEAMHGMVADKPESRTRQALEKIVARLKRNRGNHV
jgi:hypothetical protein